MSDRVHDAARAQRRSRSKRGMLASVLRHTGLTALLLRFAPWRGVVVLSYHRIGDGSRSSLHKGLFSATQQVLDEQLRLLRRRFELIGPHELEESIRAGLGRRVMVTFDDGYRDLYDAALPVLEANDVRAAIFLCTGFIDGDASAWWDEIAWMARRSKESVLAAGPWSAQPLRLEPEHLEDTIGVITRRYWELPSDEGPAFLDELSASAGTGRRPAGADHADWITWDMARELHRAGHAIGAHTVRHPVLSRLSVAGQRREIADSAERIAAELGERPRWLAYPVGVRAAFTRDTEAAARDAGIELAFSNYGGRVTPRTFSPLDVRRTPAEMLRDPAIFSATLSCPTLFSKAGKSDAADRPNRFSGI